ncbi:MAG: C25 family cysteine peptidase, partial [Planctomycetota bacterium]
MGRKSGIGIGLAVVAIVVLIASSSLLRDGRETAVPQEDQRALLAERPAPDQEKTAVEQPKPSPAGEWRPAQYLSPNSADGPGVRVRIDRMEPDRMELTYSIPAPVAVKSAVPRPDGERPWERIVVAGAPQAGEPGRPVLPVVPTKLIVAKGYAIEKVEVLSGDATVLEGTHAIEPGQHPVPFLPGAKGGITEGDPAIYGSDDAYPGTFHDVVGVQKRRGVSFLMVNLHPVQYQPQSGTVTVHGSLTVKVTAAPTDEEGDMRYRPDPVRALTSGADNPQMLEEGGYEETPPGEDPRPLGLCDPADSYQYVIVTSAAMRDATTDYTLRDLITHRQGLGLAATIVTIEDVYANYSGVDNSEKLREFVRDAYNNWETDFVLLGGDTNVMPFRELYAWGVGDALPEPLPAEHEDDIPSDLYFQCLDGPFNDDGDTHYGETNDGAGGGDIDLLSEVYIGRFSAANTTEMSNAVYKTIAYETHSSSDSYLRKALIAGEHLGFGGIGDYGKPYMEEVRLGTSEHGYSTAGFASCPAFSCDTLYEMDQSWSGSTMISRINSNQYANITHLGHANSNYVFQFYNSDADGLTNTKLIFAHSQGCIPGAFDRDCIAEHMTTSHRRGMYAVVFNARYGWGLEFSTDGPSQRVTREMWDAYFAEDIWNLGAMLADGHEDNAWCINYNAVRWCVYETNLLGDPHVVMRGREGYPYAVITSPQTNTPFTAGDNVTITANAWDPGGGITKVEFYNGGTRLGQDTSAPYAYTWTNVPQGTHTLKVVATDTSSRKAYSAPVTIFDRGQIASLPFSEDFESGPLARHWKTTGTENWRVQRTSANSPHGGSYHVTLDASPSGTYSRSELTLMIDLRGASNVELRYWACEWGDENHSPPPSPFTTGAG